MLKLLVKNSDHDKDRDKYKLNPEQANYLELLIFACFRVNILDIISVKAQLSKAFSIPPSEVDRMPFWEFELYVKELEKLVKEENSQSEDQMNKSGARDMMKTMKNGGPSKMMENMTPKMPSMSMPKTISMPSFKG